jgi:hypothetical protein
MSEQGDKERELELREQELQKREQEIRLRELEREIYKEQEPPLYNTKKHEKPESKIALFTKKVTKIAKFVGFTIAGIAIIRIGMFVGMWLTYGLMATIVGFVAYKLFLEETDGNK